MNINALSEVRSANDCLPGEISAEIERLDLERALDLLQQFPDPQRATQILNQLHLTEQQKQLVLEELKKRTATQSK